MAENLIPSGLPYGGRKQLRESRQAAGLPLNATGGGPAPSQGPPARAGAPALPTPPPAQAFRSDFDPLRELTPESFPGLTAGPAGVEMAPEVSFIDRVADTAASALVREVAGRLAGRRPGGRQ